MINLFSKIHEIMNQIKGTVVGYSISDKKMLFEYNNKLFVFECREVDDFADIYEAMRKIKYL
jgi:hypothetical protein